MTVFSPSFTYKSFCKASGSATKQQDNHHLAGDATGIMPVYLFETEVNDMETALRSATCIMFAAMASVCLLGGIAVLTKPLKRKDG